MEDMLFHNYRVRVQGRTVLPRLGEEAGVVDLPGMHLQDCLSRVSSVESI